MKGVEAMKIQSFKTFTDQENETWKILFKNLKDSRQEQIVPMFQEGLDVLGITGAHIPDLDNVNERLKKLTGWQGIPVEGLEGGDSFYPALAERKFPIGNFIREAKDLAYTPAPDIFHDLYGHIPFYANKDYADFCAEYGRRASKYIDRPDVLEKFERFFWFTAEFGLVKTEQGIRIFGAGIVSSKNECNYSLSKGPEVVPFDIKVISEQEYRIDIMQEKLFLLENPEQLYSCLDDFENLVAN